MSVTPKMLGSEYAGQLLMDCTNVKTHLDTSSSASESAKGCNQYAFHQYGNRLYYLTTRILNIYEFVEDENGIITDFKWIVGADGAGKGLYGLWSSDMKLFFFQHYMVYVGITYTEIPKRDVNAGDNNSYTCYINFKMTLTFHVYDLDGDPCIYKTSSFTFEAPDDKVLKHIGYGWQSYGGYSKAYNISVIDSKVFRLFVFEYAQHTLCTDSSTGATTKVFNNYGVDAVFSIEDGEVILNTSMDVCVPSFSAFYFQDPYTLGIRYYNTSNDDKHSLLIHFDTQTYKYSETLVDYNLPINSQDNIIFTVNDGAMMFRHYSYNLNYHSIIPKSCLDAYITAEVMPQYGLNCPIGISQQTNTSNTSNIANTTNVLLPLDNESWLACEPDTNYIYDTQTKTFYSLSKFMDYPVKRRRLSQESSVLNNRGYLTGTYSNSEQIEGFFANRYIFNYKGIYYGLSNRLVRDESLINNYAASNVSFPIYNYNPLISKMKYCESKDTFYASVAGTPPICPHSNNITQVVHIMTDRPDNADIPCLLILHNNNEDDVDIIIHRDTLKSSYDFASHPIILNPGWSLHAMVLTEGNLKIRFTAFGCEIS